MYLEKLKEIVLDTVAVEEHIAYIDTTPSVRGIIRAKSALNGVKKKINELNDGLEVLKKEYIKAEGISKKDAEELNSKEK